MADKEGDDGEKISLETEDKDEDVQTKTKSHFRITNVMNQLKEISLKTFLMVLMLHIVPTWTDIVTDAVQANNYINGNHYTFRMENLSSVRNNCIHLSTHIYYIENRNISYELVSCFEKDPIWGWVTAGIIFLPGFLFAVTDLYKMKLRFDLMNETSFQFDSFLWSFLTPISFPIRLFIVQVKCLISNSPIRTNEMVKYEANEGEFESCLQYLLSLVVMCSRTDRLPSTIQLFSLFTSLLMVVKLCVFRFIPNIFEDLNKIKEAVPLLPLILFNVVFKLGSLAVIISFFRLWCFLLVLLMVIIIFVVENNAKEMKFQGIWFLRFLGGIVSTVSVLLVLDFFNNRNTALTIFEILVCLLLINQNNY